MLNSKLISFLLNYNFKIASIIALFLAILFSILAINLIPLSRDYENYIELFLNAKNAKSYFNSIESTEIIFSTLAFITRNFIFTALVLGLLGLYIKFKFFLYFKSASLVIIFYYLARFFIVLDVTQLRISFGISMLLVGFFVCTKKECLGGFGHGGFPGCFAHYSHNVYFVHFNGQTGNRPIRTSGSAPPSSHPK